MSTTKKYIGESQLTKTPLSKISLVINKGAITSDKLAKGAVVTEKVSECVINDLVKPITDDLQEQINRLAEHGFVVEVITEQQINNICI